MQCLPVCYSYIHHFLPMQRLVLQLVTSNKYKRKLNWESLLFRYICSQLRANGDRHFHCIERKASFPMKIVVIVHVISWWPTFEIWTLLCMWPAGSTLCLQPDNYILSRFHDLLLPQYILTHTGGADSNNWGSTPFSWWAQAIYHWQKISISKLKSHRWGLPG